MQSDRTERPATTLPRIKLPPIPPPTPEELERRGEVIDRILALGVKIGRSRFPEMSRGFEPSAFMIQSFDSAQAEWSVESAEINAMYFPSGE